MNPLAKPVVDHSVSVSLQPVQVTYNCHTVQSVLEMFKLPPSVRLHKTSSLAAVALDQVKTQSRIGLQHAIENRKILDINVVLHSPVVLLPEAGVLDGASRILVVDLGSLTLTSDMKPVIPDLRVRQCHSFHFCMYLSLSPSLPPSLPPSSPSLSPSLLSLSLSPSLTPSLPLSLSLHQC